MREEKEKRVEVGFVIPQLSQKILDNPDVLEYFLTKREQKVLEIINESKESSTTSDIRYRYLEDISSKNFPTEKLLPKPLTKKERFKFIKNHLKSLEKPFNLKIPSFGTIERILLSLEKLGLVGRRYDPLKKGKYLWIINPNYLIALKEQKKIQRRIK